VVCPAKPVDGCQRVGNDAAPGTAECGPSAAGHISRDFDAQGLRDLGNLPNENSPAKSVGNRLVEVE
jgi:hypothetical protein